MRDREKMTISGPIRSGSFNLASSASSSLRRHSLSSSHVSSDHRDDDSESEAISEVGDIGDRALHCGSYSESGRLCLSFDNVVENGVIVPVLEAASLQPDDFSSHISTTFNTKSAIPPPTLEIKSAASADGTMQPQYLEKENEKTMPWILEYISCLICLALFGILGVMMQNLFNELSAR